MSQKRNLAKRKILTAALLGLRSQKQSSRPRKANLLTVLCRILLSPKQMFADGQ